MPYVVVMVHGCAHAVFLGYHDGTVLFYDVGLVLRCRTCPTIRRTRTGGARSRAAEGPTLGPDARGPSRRPQERVVKRAAAGLDAQAAAVTEIS